MPSDVNYFTTEGTSTHVFDFLSMTGTLVPTGEHFEDVVYPGVDGRGFWLTGTRGEPFTLKTEADFATAALANTELASYVSKIMTQKLDVYRNGVLKGTVVVRNVVEEQIKQLGLIRGGINVSSGVGVLLVCTWTLEGLV